MGAALYDVLPFENLYWSQFETLSTEEMQAIQLSRLRQSVERARNVPFYAERLAGLQGSIASVDDVRQLPLTTLAEVMARPLAERLGVPRYKIACVSGFEAGVQTLAADGSSRAVEVPQTTERTTGKTAVSARSAFLNAWTERDLEAAAERCARFLYANGVRGNHLLTDLTSGELWRGAARISAGWLRAEKTTVDEAVRSMRSEELLLSTAQLKRLAGNGRLLMDASLPLRAVFVEMDLQADSLADSVEWARSSTVPVYRCLTLPALGGCVAFECHEHAGFHVQEDDFLIECLDPVTLEPVPDGTPGELVITSLRQEATPLVRLRTGKTVVLDRASCACGRERLRLRF